MHLFLEYTPHGDLHHYIYGNFEAFTWKKKTRYLDFIIKGIKKIHDKKIIHRDLHSEITTGTPECWANLMKRCWHSNPSQRSTIEEFNELSTTFHYYVKNNKPDKFDVWLEFKEANQTRF
ncbi:hypothetical protein Glove_346g136 [Diversispora epigaea]|uniref:Protein kinase domain-containing protein n=1 Tax=Diversispora epigaea TaxID=1348612 RepID=A0A397HJS5_9GLOM|nr:hypothetical protein Glove_346g132 [Diversispora epigaea]RHZ61648.1 hypothetical protein Glove_346g136 [Diversispora epigaea]